jgi:hypothetical protein
MLTRKNQYTDTVLVGFEKGANACTLIYCNHQFAVEQCAALLLGMQLATCIFKYNPDMIVHKRSKEKT